METGTVFDIKGFALNDGPGIRTTVFLKGCPLRCLWCHNPEGLSPEPELLYKSARCRHCGKCARPCSHPECQRWGRCLRVCPEGCLTVAGREWTAEELYVRLERDRDLFGEDGGVTFSGGEPLLQWRFVCETADRLRKAGIRCAVETSSFAPEEAYREVLSRMDFVMADCKLMDGQAHRTYCGVPNDGILKNLGILMQSGVPYLIRVPLIPGITDTEDNLRAISAFVGDSPVELLPYNAMAGAKYASVGKRFVLPEAQRQSPDSLDGMGRLFKNARVRR